MHFKERHACVLLFFAMLIINASVFGQKNKNKVNHYTITAQFIRAGVWEGAGSYTFKDRKGKAIHFVFDQYPDRKMPYPFFDEETNANVKLVGARFRITYIRQWEVRGDSEEKNLVNRIVRIVRVKN